MALDGESGGSLGVFKLLRKRITGIGGLILISAVAFLAWVFLVLLASRPEFRKIIDTTPGQSASVQPWTADLIGDLRNRDEVRVEIYTFFQPIRQRAATPQMEALVAISRRIEALTKSLLRQYAALGGDKLRVQHVIERQDPQKTRELIERLGGLKQRHVVVIAAVRKTDKGEAIQKKVIPLRDLAVIDTGADRPNMPGANRRMPRLTDFTGEEQLSSAIKTLLAGGTPTVFLIKGHGEELATNGESPYDYTNLVASLQEDGFKVTDINLKSQPIPKNATVLACLEPKTGFLDSEAQAIHAYLRRGGRLFINLSYHEVASRNSPLKNLLGPLGVQVGSKRVSQFWDYANASEAARVEIYPRNTALSITKSLVAAGRTISLVNARRLFETEEAVPNVSFDGSLLRTEKKCWLAERDGVASTSNRPPRNPTNAYSVGGIVTVKQTEGEHSGRVILIGGLGFNNTFIDRGSQRDFARNCFAWLAERREHVGGGADRGPLSAVIQHRSNPDDLATLRIRSLWLLFGVVPGSFFVLGLLVWWRRRRA